MTELFDPGDLTNGAVVVAASQIGVKEDGPNTGKEIDEYLRSVGLSPGFSWCAAFVHWCFARAADAIEMLNPCPRTGGVLAMWEGCHDLAKAVDPTRGSIVIMDHGRGHGHTGIVESVNGGGLIETIEGNTNRGGSRTGDSVCRHIWRPEDGARGKLIGYIDFSRIPLVYKKDAMA